jgi:TetR/AcrR family transcriptional repressor of uid operon
MAKPRRTDTADRLKQAATQLFLERGYGGTTIADIETGAGLAPRSGTFYRHFESKEALLVAIGEEVIERPGEVLTERTLSLGDTRAELVLIARGYQQAADRQAPLRALIAETASLPGIQALVAEVEMELGERIGRWLAQKPATQNMDAAEQAALFFQIIGGWTFWLSKRGTPAFPPELDDRRMLDLWADRWAAVLDEAP